MSDLGKSVVKVAGGASVVTLVGGGLVVGGGVAEAQTFTASNEAELIQAIQAANAAGGADTITISGTTITLSASLPKITDELTITGAGQGSTIIDGNDHYFVFYARDAVSLTVEDLTIQNAYRADNGAAVIVRATDLTISYVTFDQNEAEFGGGAVFFRTSGVSAELASVSISNSIFTNNIAGDGGGAVMVDNPYTYLEASITDSTFTSNSASYGGAIVVYDRSPESAGVTYLTIDRSTFNDNSSSATGGAVHVTGETLGEFVTSIAVTDSTFSGNIGGGAGGAMFVSKSGSNGAVGRVTIDGSTFTTNSAGAHGGAVYVSYADAYVSDSEFTGNVSEGYGGALAGYEMRSLTVTNSSFAENQASFGGGALYFNRPPSDIGRGYLDIANSTFSNNSASRGGAVIAEGEVSISQSTITGNESGGGGGAIYFWHGTPAFTNALTIENSTIVANYGYPVAGINTSYATELTLVNTILSANTSPLSVGDDDLSTRTVDGQNGGAATVVSIDHSIVGVSSVDVPSAGSGNIVSSDPMLGVLGDNGGDTETMVPLSGSPAIDAGDSSVHEFDTDQRGGVRVQYAAIDIGAVEVQEPVASTTTTTTTVPAPTTTTDPSAGVLPPTGSGSRTGVLAVLLTGFGAVLTLGASRRRRTN